MEDSVNLHENREVFEEVLTAASLPSLPMMDVRTIRHSVYERELSDLAYRPLPGSEEVVASFKTIVRLLLKKLQWGQAPVPRWSEGKT